MKRCATLEINTWRTRSNPWTVFVESIDTGLDLGTVLKRIASVAKRVAEEFIPRWVTDGYSIGGSPFPPRYNEIRYCVEETPAGRIEVIVFNPGGVWETKVTSRDGEVVSVYSHLVPREARLAMREIYDALEEYMGESVNA